MNTIRFLPVLCSCLLGICSSCGSMMSHYQAEQLSTVQFDSLQQVYTQLNDSLHWAREVITQEDDNKIANMHHLLEEMKYAGCYAVDTLSQLQQQVQQLTDMQHNAANLAGSGKAVAYDSVTQVTGEALVLFAEKHPGFEQNPVIEVLTDRVRNAVNSLLLYRLQYDRLSQEFNHFLEEYRGIINRLDTSRTVRKQPVFGLMTGYDDK